MEEEFSTTIDAFVASVAKAKAEQLSQLQAAKSAIPPRIEDVRLLGRGLGELSSIVTQARALDKVARERLQVASLRIASYRASCAVRPLSSQAQLIDVPPTRAGYDQVLDFYRFTDSSSYSFGRQFDGPQFFTDIRRNVAILSASRGPLNGDGDRERGAASSSAALTVGVPCAAASMEAPQGRVILLDSDAKERVNGERQGGQAGVGGDDVSSRAC